MYANEGNLLGKKGSKKTKALLDISNKVNTEKISNICQAARMQDKITTQRELKISLKMWLIQIFGNDTRN